VNRIVSVILFVMVVMGMVGPSMAGSEPEQASKQEPVCDLLNNPDNAPVEPRFLTCWIAERSTEICLENLCLRRCYRVLCCRFTFSVVSCRKISNLYPCGA